MGWGKTTLTRLLFRFYDVDSGEIRMGGQDLRQVRLQGLRQKVGMVTQDVQIFKASLRENLSLFDEHIDDERLLKAIEELGLGPWFRSLPEGLDSTVSSGALSAGEAQLLAFARVFLKDPGLVILDEPSSRLDPATAEARIDRAVQKLLEGRTGIIIAHHLGTVEKVDEIMVLQGGQIVEHGARAELVRDPNSRFAQLLSAGLRRCWYERDAKRWDHECRYDPPEGMTTGRTALKLLRYRPGLFLATVFFRGLDDLQPFAVGLIMQAFFNALSGDAPAGLNAWTLVVLFVLLELGDRVTLFIAAVVGVRWRFHVESLLRKNLLQAVMEVHNPRQVSVSSGEATNRFRDDVGGGSALSRTVCESVGEPDFCRLGYQLHG